MIKTHSTQIIYKWLEAKPEHESIELLNWLSRDVGWAKVVVHGPESLANNNTKILLSRRVVSHQFEIDGVVMGDTADNSVLCFDKEGQLFTNKDTILYTWIEPEEETTESGIVLVKKTATKEFETRWAEVKVAPLDTPIKVGDHILLKYKHDAYAIENIIPGVKLHNADWKHEVILFKHSK